MTTPEEIAAQVLTPEQRLAHDQLHGLVEGEIIGSTSQMAASLGMAPNTGLALVTSVKDRVAELGYGDKRETLKQIDGINQLIGSYAAPGAVVIEPVAGAGPDEADNSESDPAPDDSLQPSGLSADNPQVIAGLESDGKIDSGDLPSWLKELYGQLRDDKIANKLHLTYASKLMLDYVDGATTVKPLIAAGFAMADYIFENDISSRFLSADKIAIMVANKINPLATSEQLATLVGANAAGYRMRYTQLPHYIDKSFTKEQVQLLQLEGARRLYEDPDFINRIWLPKSN